MASITSTGIGSQLNVESIITQLMDIEKKPLTSLQTKAATLDSKISAFGTLKSQLSALSDAATRLATASTWNAKTASSSNAAAVSAGVTAAGDAVASSFSMEVTQLARAQAVSSGAVAAGTGFGLGTLSIQLGDWNDTDVGGPGFMAGARPAVEVDVAEGDTLASIAAKINAAGAGVSATVLKDISGERLMLRSGTTGEAAGFRVSAAPAGTGSGADLGLLAFDAASPGQGMAANPVQYARNAEATINGVAIRSGTNVLADTVPGLTLTLAQITTAPVEVSVATDTSGLRSAIQAFVTAYNTMNTTLNAATAYDAASKTAALLQGDSTAVSLQNALRGLMGAPSGGGAVQNLSQLGITVAKDGAGNLVVDTAKLDTALKDPAAVQRFFAAAEAAGNDGATGLATRLSVFTRAAIAADGTLDTRTQSLKTQRKDNDKSQDKLADRLTLTEKRLRAQYTALDTRMASLTALNTYITQQVAQWNKSTG